MKENKLLAHKTTSNEQSILEHNENMTKMLELKLNKKKLPNTKLYLALGKCLILLHDLGKYNSGFQDKIKGNTKKPFPHAVYGACYLLKILKEMFEEENWMFYLAQIISSHHTELNNIDKIRNIILSKMRLNGKSSENFKIKTKNAEAKEEINQILEKVKTIIANEINIAELENLKYEDYKFLYSLLCDIDYRDAENFSNNTEYKEKNVNWKDLLNKKENYYEQHYCK